MMTEKLDELGRKLPPSALAELIDFAEFLYRKYSQSAGVKRGSLAELGGGLETSSTFADDPLVIQERLRREWD